MDGESAYARASSGASTSQKSRPFIKGHVFWFEVGELLWSAVVNEDGAVARGYVEVVVVVAGDGEVQLDGNDDGS